MAVLTIGYCSLGLSHDRHGGLKQAVLEEVPET